MNDLESELPREPAAGRRLGVRPVLLRLILIALFAALTAMTILRGAGLAGIGLLGVSVLLLARGTKVAVGLLFGVYFVWAFLQGWWAAGAAGLIGVAVHGSVASAIFGLIGLGFTLIAGRYAEVFRPSVPGSPVGPVGWVVEEEPYE